MKIEKYKTAHQLARELLAGDDLICIIAAPTFDMPGCSTALPVAAARIEVQGIACIKISAAAMPNGQKLSHGANNCKRGFAAKCKMKEQPPLAPALC